MSASRSESLRSTSMAVPIRSAILMLKLTTLRRPTGPILESVTGAANAPSNRGELGFSRLTVLAQDARTNDPARTTRILLTPATFLTRAGQASGSGALNEGWLATLRSAPHNRDYPSELQPG